DPVGIAQAPGVGLPAELAGIGAAAAIAAGGRIVAAPAAGRGGEGVARRDAAVAGDSQDLAQQSVTVAGGVVAAGLAAAVVAAAVADADVEIAILAEVQVAGVVVAVGRGDVIDQDQLAAGAISAE